jgi:hypothetical protein
MDSRALNRATLDRQLLLRRHPLMAGQAVAHLMGMQAQAPLAPYTGLWTRLQDFTPEALSTLTSERLLLRAHLMRNTVHLLTAQDYLDFRPMYHELGELCFSRSPPGRYEALPSLVAPPSLLSPGSAAALRLAGPRPATESGRPCPRCDPSHPARPGPAPRHLGQERARSLGFGRRIPRAALDGASR